MEIQLSGVNVHQVTDKIGSKKELHDFLTQECAAYLPKLGCCNVYFLKSILNGQKECLKRCEVIVAAVPKIEGHTADDFLNYAQQKPSLLSFLPNQCDWLHLDKKWICDILLSLDNQEVNQMILQAKQKRRDKLDQSQNLIVHMKPEFARALSDSLNYSGKAFKNYHAYSIKGKIGALLKQSSQRKRRVKEVEEVKGEVIAMRFSKQRYIEDNKRMRDEFNGMIAQLDELVSYKSLVHQLHDNGVIDNEGRILASQQNLDMI